MEEEKQDDDLQKVFEKLYMGSILIAKKNKELKIKLEVITNENEQLQEANTNLEHKLAQSRDQCKELQQLFKAREENVGKLIDGSQKLSNMLLSQKSRSCKLGLGGYNHKGEYNKPLVFV